jgi:hypothetical protein
MRLLLLLLLAAGVWGAAKEMRGAIIITLAGNHKLSEYFEWSCRSIGASAELFDMLVFHEGNSVLKKVHCAKNVKYIDLGVNGMSKLIVDEVLHHNGGNATGESSRVELINLLADIVTHIPRYLVEPKPMFGTLFRDYLAAYSHWSYSDPDIVWGNLCDWISKEDMTTFDLITLSKTYDAGRLFIRGQFALHKNTAAVNNVWRGLEYFNIHSFATRIGGAARQVRENRKSEDVFGSFFKSAEGYYSQLFFKSGKSVKIIGRGVDDYSREPVIVVRGQLYRCGVEEAAACVPAILSSPSNVSIRSLPPFASEDAKAVHDKSQCRMQWLPVDVRYCIVEETYPDGGSAGGRGEGSRVRLKHVGEAVLQKGKWSVNDEEAARRQVKTVSAFFHFRHWDDYASLGLSTAWDAKAPSGELGGCMMLYLRPDGAMSFEPCEVGLETLRASAARGERVLSLREIEQKRKIKNERQKREGRGGAARRKGAAALLMRRNREQHHGSTIARGNIEASVGAALRQRGHRIKTRSELLAGMAKQGQGQ